MKNIKDGLLLNSQEFKIEQADIEDEEQNTLICKRLIEKWTPELETQVLDAFVDFYCGERAENLDPDDEESKELWPEIRTPEDLIEYTGTDVTLYALEDAIYGKSKDGSSKYESLHVPICVIMTLKCPWDEEHGWAAVFVNEKFVLVNSDIVDCVWLD